MIPCNLPTLWSEIQILSDKPGFVHMFSQLKIFLCFVISTICWRKFHHCQNFFTFQTIFDNILKLDTIWRRWLQFSTILNFHNKTWLCLFLIVYTQICFVTPLHKIPPDSELSKGISQHWQFPPPKGGSSWDYLTLDPGGRISPPVKSYLWSTLTNKIKIRLFHFCFCLLCCLFVMSSLFDSILCVSKPV